MPAARHSSRSPCIALAVIATIRGRRSAGQRRAISREASNPSISGIWTSINTRSYGCRSMASTASRPLAATSARYPICSSRRSASFWFTTLSSATRIRKGWRRAISGSSSSRDGVRLSTRIGWPARTPTSASNSCDGLIGFVRCAANPTFSAPASRRPSEVKSSRGNAAAVRCSRIARARATPSSSGMCMSRIPASNSSPAWIQARASRGEPVVRTAIPQVSRYAARIRRLVSLSSTTSTRLASSVGCVPCSSRRGGTAPSAEGACTVNRNSEP